MFLWSNTFVIRGCCTSSVSFFLAFICSDFSLFFNWGLFDYTIVSCRIDYFLPIPQNVKSVSTAQSIICCQITKNQHKCQLCLPSLTNLIVSVDLVPMTRSLYLTWWIYLQRRHTSNLWFQLGIRFSRIQFVTNWNWSTIASRVLLKPNSQITQPIQFQIAQ